jgi:hypothetical protein
MALKYPLITKIGIPVLIALVIVFHVIRRKYKFKGGVRVANTSYARNLPEYKTYKNVHGFLKIVMEFSIIIAIVASLFLMARPVKTETVSNGTKKRDIYLCLDVSYSICYLNYDLVDSLKEVVKGLDGDRFGITIYNTSTVLYVPMTDDYDFILKKLDDLKTYFELQREYVENYWNVYYYQLDERYYELSELLSYYDAGTLVNNYTKGSSLIGEGLASALFSFPHLDDENRTRIIIMSTDNAQEALSKPLVELDEASDMCKNNGVTIFGIFPNEQVFTRLNDYSKDYDKLAREMKEDVEKTGGAFYKQTDTVTVKDIVNDIQSQKVMEVNEITINKVVDKPAIPAIILCIAIILLLISGAIILL